MLWLVPVLCLASSILTQWLMPKITRNQMAMQGCMKWMMLFCPCSPRGSLIPYRRPWAYWIINTVLTFGQTWVLNIFYNADAMIAKQEAGRIALRELRNRK